MSVSGNGAFGGGALKAELFCMVLETYERGSRGFLVPCTMEGHGTKISSVN